MNRPTPDSAAGYGLLLIFAAALGAILALINLQRDGLL